MTWIDVFPVFLNESGTAIRDGFSNDRVHLLGAGYLAWRDALTPYLPDSEAPAVVTGAPSG